MKKKEKAVKKTSKNPKQSNVKSKKGSSNINSQLKKMLLEQLISKLK